MTHAKNMITVLIVASTIAITASAEVTPTTDAEVRRIIEEIDQLYRSESSRAVFEMEIVTPHWQRTLKMEAWSLGTERTLIRINSPKKEKGVGTLRVDNEMWNYLPKTNKVIKVPPSMMMSSWMGSDFTNDDLVQEFSLFEDYSYELVTPDSAREDLIYINCVPREDLPIVWGNIVIAATRKEYLPVWQRYYDESGRLMRTENFSEIRTFSGRRIPSVMEMVPQSKEGHKTVIRYLELELDLELDSARFSLRDLRNPN
ncbi:MAG: outer membrane lipoprotein-sorting protein [candidate division Zixibacteria bacterium]|nr:outer membrane lipoprotein-sorting protein [candidate division Zixibacteria bacterium]MDH3936846.1 outer membrane lipoprotein-sorting protein [candidate division Zixibacteria bacterium]MDH4033139.1 outer membrane lipoprotein-sorting protein [candidate division Zixibacteria bacterium]